MPPWCSGLGLGMKPANPKQIHNQASSRTQHGRLNQPSQLPHPKSSESDLKVGLDFAEVQSHLCLLAIKKNDTQTGHNALKVIRVSTPASITTFVLHGLRAFAQSRVLRRRWT